MRRFPALLVAGLAALVLTDTVRAQPPVVLDARYYGRVREWSRRLVTDLEYLQQDIAQDVRGPGAGPLVGLASATYKSALHFDREVRNDIPRDVIYRDYAILDANLHKLLDAVRPLAAANPHLLRAANRAQYSDQQLHVAMSVGDATPGRGKTLLARQVDVLALQAGEYVKVMDWATGGSGAGARLRDNARAFADSVASLDQTTDDVRGNPERLGRDFARVANAWAAVINALNAPEATPGLYLRTKTQEIQQTVEDIRTRLNMRDPYVRLK